jgi:hypothetical protein
MELAADFTFRPLPPLADPISDPFPDVANPLGPLAGLVGTWSGPGFNNIWRPDHSSASDHFLELNLTTDQLAFDFIAGQIPDRGLLQPDMNMFGLRYLQQVSDRNLNAGLHIEPGLWVDIPATSDPTVDPTVARLASIPHGTTILAQGTATDSAGAPDIPKVDITPFGVDDPTALVHFVEQTLDKASKFRTSGTGLHGITQKMLDNPNSVLTDAIAGRHIAKTTTLHVSTNDAPVPGGGTQNTAFLKGGLRGANARAARATATFWLETLEGDTIPNQLQYTQLVLLNFAGLSWPHVTVATLKRTSGTPPTATQVNPPLPVSPPAA